MGCCNPGHCGTKPGIYDQWAMGLNSRKSKEDRNRATPPQPIDFFQSTQNPSKSDRTPTLSMASGDTRSVVVIVFIHLFSLWLIRAEELQFSFLCIHRLNATSKLAMRTAQVFVVNPKP